MRMCWNTRSALSVLIIGVAACVARADVTWNLKAGANQSVMSGTTSFFGTDYHWRPQDHAGAGLSLTAQSLGSFVSTNSFLTSVDLGPAPVFSSTPTAEEIAAQLKVIPQNNGDWLPQAGGGVDGPDPDTDPDPFAYGTAQPANFGLSAYDAASDGEFGLAAWRAGANDFFSPAGGVALTPNAGAASTSGSFDATGIHMASFSILDFNIAIAAASAPLLSDQNNEAVGAVGTIGRAFDAVTGTNRLYTISFPFTLADVIDNDPVFTTLSVVANISAVADVAAGDVNFDGVVDIFDVNVISDNWSGDGPASAGSMTPGDANGDGKVDIFDVNMVSDNWTTGGGAAAVPEPATLGILALGCVGLGVARVRVRRSSKPEMGGMELGVWGKVARFFS